jgi:hypothetical protein
MRKWINLLDLCNLFPGACCVHRRHPQQEKYFWDQTKNQTATGWRQHDGEAFLGRAFNTKITNVDDQH